MERISKNKYKVNKHLKDTHKSKNEKKKKLTKKQKIIIIVSIIISIFAILSTIVGTYIYKADGNIADAAINIMADVVGDDRPITVLVLGVSEGIDVPLTDTIMLAGYNPKTQKAFMVSIPRDTYIGTNDNYADGYSKINSVYQKGVKKTVKQVEKITGVEINHYIVVKTSALVQIVDAIGGVNFDVPIDMDYDDPTQNLHIDLKAGMQLIDGPKAEQLLRFRHNNDGSSYPSSYGDNDYGRMRTQREFIKATASQIIKWENLTKIKEITSAIFDNLETDMSLPKMIGYIPSVLKFDMANLQMQQLPGQSERINGLWFYTHDLSKTKTLMTEFMQSLELEEKKYKELYTPISTKSKRIRKVEEESNVVGNNIIIENTTIDQTNTAVTNTNIENTNTVTQKCSHNWTSKIEKEATCTSSGTKKLTCTLCEEVKTETIKEKGHVWVETSRVEATTETEGKITSECSNCGEVSEKKIDKLPESTGETEEPPTPTPEQPEDNTTPNPTVPNPEIEPDPTNTTV